MRKYRLFSILFFIILLSCIFVNSFAQTTDIIATGKFSDTEALDVSVAAISDDAYVVTYTKNREGEFGTKVALGIRSGANINFVNEASLFEQQHITDIQTIAMKPSLVVAVGKFAVGGNQYAVIAFIHIDLKTQTLKVNYDKGLRNISTAFDKFAIAYITNARIGLAYYTLMKEGSNTRELYVMAISMDDSGFSESIPVLVYSGRINDLAVNGFGGEEYFYGEKGMTVCFNQDSSGGAAYVQTYTLIDGYEIDKKRILDPVKFTDFAGSLSLARISNKNFIVVYNDEDNNISMKYDCSLTDDAIKISDAYYPYATAKGLDKCSILIAAQKRHRFGITCYLGVIFDPDKPNFTEVNSVNTNTINSISIDYPKQHLINQYAFAYGSQDTGQLIIAKLPQTYESERFQNSRSEEKYKK